MATTTWIRLGWAGVALLALGACGEGIDDDQPPQPPPVGSWRAPQTIVGFRSVGVAASDRGDLFLLADSSVRRWVGATGRWNGLYQIQGVDQLAVGPEGDALVAGEVLGNGAILGSAFTTGDGWVDGWSPLAPLTPRVDDLPTITALAMPGGGTAVLGWTLQPPQDSKPATAQVAVFEPGVGWTPPFLFAGPEPRLAPVMAAADLGGELRIVAAWREPGDVGQVEIVGDVLHYNRATHALNREGPTVLDRRPGTDGARLEVGIDDSGRATVLVVGLRALTVAHHFAGWDPAVTTAADAGHAWRPDDVHLAVDTDGAVLVMSTQCAEDCVTRVQYALPDGLGAPVELARGPDADLAGPTCIAAAGGRALAVWREGAGSWTMRARELAGEWRAPTVIAEDFVAATFGRCELALARIGHGIVGWTHEGLGPDRAVKLTTAIYTVD